MLDLLWLIPALPFAGFLLLILAGSRLPRIARLLVPEPDQQVAAETDPFPSEVQEHQVVRKHQHEHCRDKQVHVREVPAVSLIFGHEFHRVKVNQESDNRDHEDH